MAGVEKPRAAGRDGKMRSILMFLVLLAALLAGGWIGGETLIARSARSLIAADPRIAAEGVAEMREPQRIGVRIDRPRMDDPARRMAASADWMEVWLPPQAPNTLHAALPAGSQLITTGRHLVAGDGGIAAELHFSPTHGLALSEAGLTAGPMTLDGAPALAGLRLDAVLSGYGHDAPPGTGAAYEVTGTAEGIGLGALSGGAMPGEAKLAGRGRLWLSAVPLTAAAVADGGSGRAPARLVGLRSDGVDVTLDALTARVYGRLVGDADGRASGEVLIDTADAEGFLNRAAAVGLLPQGAVPLATAALTGLARGATATAATAASATPEPAGGGASAGIAQPAAMLTDAKAGTRGPDGQTYADRAVEEADANRAPEGPDASLVRPEWPQPQAGQIRIPLIFKGGTVSLGPVPLGPAPMLGLR